MDIFIISYNGNIFDRVVIAMCVYSLCANQMGLSKVALFVLFILSSRQTLCKSNIGMYIA